MMASIMGEHSRTQKNTSAIILSYTIVHDRTRSGIYSKEQS
jgi:hypothetical protein